MDSSRLLLLIFMLTTPSECSEMAESQCKDLDTETINLLEGEAFYFVPYVLDDGFLPDEEFTWYKKSSQIEYISTDKNEAVHYQGGALIFLNLSTENSGFYTARHNESGKCFNYYVHIDVFKAKMGPALYGDIDNTDVNKKITCPGHISAICEELTGNLTWRKHHLMAVIHYLDLEDSPKEVQEDMKWVDATYQSMVEKWQRKLEAI